MTTAWDLKQLCTDVEDVYGREQRQLLEPCLQTIHERLRAARYHYNETKRLLDSFTEGKSEVDLVGWLFGESPSPEQSFDTVRFQAAAHVTAAVLSIHSLADIAAHATYFALGLNLDPLTAMKERQISAKSVLKKLTGAHPHVLLGSLMAGKDYVYMDALANHSKHRSIVPIPFHVDLSGQESRPHGLRFGSFTFDGVQYDDRWVTDVLSSEYFRQEATIRDLGFALNASVATMRTDIATRTGTTKNPQSIIPG